QVVDPVDALWGTDRVKSGASSAEGLLEAVRDRIMTRHAVREGGHVTGYEEVESDPGVSDKRLLLVESEFSSLLKQDKRQGNTLPALLGQAWDSRRVLQTLTRSNPLTSTGAHISVIGHVTAEELRRLLTETDAANGFGNRFVWACVRRSKTLPRGSTAPPE